MVEPEPPYAPWLYSSGEQMRDLLVQGRGLADSPRPEDDLIAAWLVGTQTLCESPC